MGCHKSTICRTIKKDIGYSSYRMSHRMLITNASKESRKVWAEALLNELKHGSTGMLRFFSNEKNFIQDQTSNSQNDRWICKDIEEVPVVKPTKFPSSVMVLGIISSEGDVMPPFFFQKDLRVTAEIYQEVLRRSPGWTRSPPDAHTSSSRTPLLHTRRGCSTMEYVTLTVAK
ncbi:unnamed protein product [Acanthosepion pharaonis]|uniref:Uncharacterized protein n=1 Tax=Acanthosepion pharaonis TaxID=158019 RepID=A0A812DFF8_ACAPH|nr:unnamed protein product [Sepia pharaonis]